MKRERKGGRRCEKPRVCVSVKRESWPSVGKLPGDAKLRKGVGKNNNIKTFCARIKGGKRERDLGLCGRHRGVGVEGRGREEDEGVHCLLDATCGG